MVGNRLQIKRDYDSGLVLLLKENKIGTPKKSMVYQHLDVDEKLLNIQSPVFINLLWKDKIVGTCCFCQRSDDSYDEPILVNYIRYLTLKESLRRKPSTTKPKKNKSSQIRQEFNSILEGNDRDSNSKQIFYAYVDPENLRSIELCNSFGFEKIGVFKSTVYSRFYPKQDKSVRRIEKHEQDLVKGKIASYYKDHVNLTFENVFIDDNYFVYVNSKNEIVAGLQANLTNWKILAMKGFMNVLLHLFTRLPILNKIINVNYRFIAVEGIFVEKGNAECLAILIDSVLKIHDMNSALMSYDITSKVKQDIDGLALGITKYFSKDKYANIIARFAGCSEKDKQRMRASPKYISVYDMT